ncbi:MAG TPA: hypothetical protein VE087_08830, partial [Xanthobacteraceae bacterium]|nr:hypothetical protein [Xanthobacteraceae bacterium]
MTPEAISCSAKQAPPVPWKDFTVPVAALAAAAGTVAAAAAGAAGLVGAIAVEDERRLLLEGVEHLSHGVRQAHHRRLHDDGRLAGGLHVARGHRGARTLVRREDVLELRAVDERLVELRVLARRVAEYVFDARGDELLG